MDLEPRLGDIIMVQIPGKVGVAIDLMETIALRRKAKWSHCAIYIGDNKVIEAETGGAREADLSEYANTRTAWSTAWGIQLGITDEQRQLIVQAAIGFKGTPYSFLDYAAVGLHEYHIPAPGLEEYIKSTKHMICSQLVDACYKAGQVKLFDDGRWEGFVPPQDIAYVIGV